MQDREIICPNCHELANWETKCPLVLSAEVGAIMRHKTAWLLEPLRKFPRPVGQMLGNHRGRRLYLRSDVLKWAKWFQGPELAALLDQVLT